MNQTDKWLSWLEKEKMKDDKELQVSKLKIIQEIKKDKIVFEKPKKITIWSKLRKVLIGY